MKRYDTYKPSGIEWIGEIPSHWECSRLKFNGESIIGIIYSPNDVVNEEEGNLVLRSSNIQDGKLAFEDCVFVNKEVQEKQLTKEGDILLCARNGSAHLVGKAAYLTKEIEGRTFGAFMSIVRSELKKYLFYFFNSQIFKAQTGLFSTSTINQLTSDTLNNMFISFPKGKEEQLAISNYLDQKTAEIDQLIADKKKLLELYEQEKTTIINQAVTKGINPNAPMKDSGIDWLGDIPEHWEVKRLKYIADLRSGNNIVSEQIKEVGDFPVFGGNGLRGYFDEFTHEGNFILIGRQGAYCGNIKYGTGKFWASEHAVVLSPKEDYEIKFIGELLKSMNLGQYSVSAAQPGLAVEVIKNLSIPFPSLEEQIIIKKFVEINSTIIDDKKSKTEKLIELLTEYRTALIAEVVTGKVKVIE